MHCNTPWEFVPVLPRGLALILILGLLLQTSGWGATLLRTPLPLLSITSARWQKFGRRRRFARRMAHAFPFGQFTATQIPRLLARWTLLGVLLHTSGWLAFSIWSGSVWLIPLVQILHASWALCMPSSTTPARIRHRAADLQRLYQLTLVLLGLSSLLQLLYHLHPAPSTVVFPLALTTWVTHPDDETEIRITTTNEKNYTVTLRGAFQL
jgi:hypothetical protein